MKRHHSALILLTALIIVFAYVQYSIKTRFISTDTVDVATTEVVTICGKELETDVVTIDGVDVARAIGAIMSDEYQRSPKTDMTTCFVMQAYLDGARIRTSATEETGTDSPLKGRHLYRIRLDDTQFLLDRATRQIYSVNTMDGSPRDIVGTFAD